MTFNQTETKLTTKMWNIRTKWPKRQTKPTHAATKETQNNTKSEKNDPKRWKITHTRQKWEKKNGIKNNGILLQKETQWLKRDKQDNMLTIITTQNRHAK